VSWKGDRTTLASAGADNAIKIWNAETGEQSRTIATYKKQVTSLNFIGMEDDFISASGDHRVSRLKAGNGGTVREFAGCPDYVYCSTTTADGAIVAAGGEDGVLRVWNGKDGKLLASFEPKKP
jgi:WD40 repeat protein